jgi:hypothetical protein
MKIGMGKYKGKLKIQEIPVAVSIYRVCDVF